MRIVIDILEQDYERVVHDDRIPVARIRNAICNGTILSKGHGRIADMDEAIKCIEEVNGEDAIWAIGLINWACGKRTLIEADKAEGEDKE